MMHNRFFYLAGPISGQTIKGATEWRDVLIMEWARMSNCPNVLPLDPMRGVQPIPGARTWELAKWPATIEYARLRDLADIDRSDVIVFGGLNSAQKVSIGSMIEWGYATAKGKRIMVLRDNGEERFHHHPWLMNPDFKAHTIDDAVRILNFYFMDVAPYQEYPRANVTRINPDPSMGVDQTEPLSPRDRFVDRRVGRRGARDEILQRTRQDTDRAYTDVHPAAEQARTRPPYPVPQGAGASGCWPPEPLPVPAREERPAGESGEHSDYEDPARTERRG